MVKIFSPKNPRRQTIFQHTTPQYYLVFNIMTSPWGVFSIYYLDISEQKPWGKCLPCRWCDQSSSQSQCAEWSEYNLLAGKTSHPRCCRQSHIGPPPTPHQPRTPGTHTHERRNNLVDYLKRNHGIYWACQSQKCSQPATEILPGHLYYLHAVCLLKQPSLFRKKQISCKFKLSFSQGTKGFFN